MEWYRSTVHNTRNIVRTTLIFYPFFFSFIYLFTYILLLFLDLDLTIIHFSSLFLFMLSSYTLEYNCTNIHPQRRNKIRTIQREKERKRRRHLPQRSNIFKLNLVTKSSYRVKKGLWKSKNTSVYSLNIDNLSITLSTRTRRMRILVRQFYIIFYIYVYIYISNRLIG